MINWFSTLIENVLNNQFKPVADERRSVNGVNDALLDKGSFLK